MNKSPPHLKKKYQGRSIKIMSKSNVAEKNTNAAEVAEVKTVEAATAPVMTIVKDTPEEPRKLSLDEKIQRVEDPS